MKSPARTQRNVAWGNTMKNPFQFALKDIFIPNILFRINPAFKSKDGEIEINTAIEVDFSHEGKDLTVHVRVELPDAENTPFAFALDGVGIFVLNEDPPADVLEMIARVNCAAMIFPYIREAVADLTRRAGVPALHLQPVNFVALMQGATAPKPVPASPPKRPSRKKTV
jgi:preprotein translocase subunit SecB